MLSIIKKQLINEIAQKIKAEGFRVFISENQQYGFFTGFFTDEKGGRVVSFQVDYPEVGYAFYSNYRAVNPAHAQSVGTGWRLDNSLTFKEMLAAAAPKWATRDYSVSYSTLEEHLKTYQNSSKFSELV